MGWRYDAAKARDVELRHHAQRVAQRLADDPTYTTAQARSDMRTARAQAAAAAEAERAAKRRWRALVNEVMTGNNGCHYCGGIATQVDHVFPRSRGGADTLDNLAPACRACNMDKLDLTVDEWKAARLAEGRCWPPESFGEVARRITAEMGMLPSQRAARGLPPVEICIVKT